MEGCRGRKEKGRGRGTKGSGKGILAIPILVCFRRRCVVFYQNMAKIPHIILLHTFSRSWNRVETMPCKFGQFIDCLICYTWPRGTPVMQSSAKCVFSICLGIRKSAERNLLLKQKIFFDRGEGCGYWIRTSGLKWFMHSPLRVLTIVTRCCSASVTGSVCHNISGRMGRPPPTILLVTKLG